MIWESLYKKKIKKNKKKVKIIKEINITLN